MSLKWIKEKMFKLFGKECMMEDLDIHYIPDILDENREGMPEHDTQLVFHHIKPVKEGGKTTVENGAILKRV